MSTFDKIKYTLAASFLALSLNACVTEEKPITEYPKVEVSSLVDFPDEFVNKPVTIVGKLVCEKYRSWMTTITTYVKSGNSSIPITTYVPAYATTYRLRPEDLDTPGSVLMTEISGAPVVPCDQGKTTDAVTTTVQGRLILGANDNPNRFKIEWYSRQPPSTGK